MITIIPRPISPFNSLNSLFPLQCLFLHSYPPLHPFIYISVRSAPFNRPVSRGDRNWLSRGEIGRNEAPNLIQLLFKQSRFTFVVRCIPFLSRFRVVLWLKKFGMDGIYIRDRDLLAERSSGLSKL